MKQNKCAYTRSQLETTMCLQFWKLENISMCLTSVCIKETVYWTELANQTQNTIYYMVWNIHLTWLAHRTRNPLLHWGTGPPSGPLWKWHFPLGVCCSDVTMVQFQMIDKFKFYQDTHQCTPPTLSTASSLAIFNFILTQRGNTPVYFAWFRQGTWGGGVLRVVRHPRWRCWWWAAA